MSGSDGLPTPVLDHVVINVRRGLEAAAECYRRLGFHLTEPSRHTIGSINRLAVFANDYLELLALDPGAPAPRAELLSAAEGLNGLVFATEDAHRLYAALSAAGAAIERPGDFSRPVALATGTEEARFRTVRLAGGSAAYGRVYFCQHLTRGLVWRDEWRRHPNGAVAIARLVLCVADPDGAASLYRTLFGAAAVRPVAGGFSLAMGLARLDILSADAVTRALVPASPDSMAVLTLRTADLARARRALGGLARKEGSRLLVEPGDAFGATLEFVE